MPGSAHISFIVAIEVAMPACGLFSMDEAIAAPPIVVLAAGVGDIAVGTMAAGDMALAVAMTICATVEEVDVVLVAMPFMPGMLAISIFAVVPFQLLDRRDGLGAEWYSSKHAVLRYSHGTETGIS